MVDYQCQRLRNRPSCGDERSTLATICWWCCLLSLVLGLILAYAWLHNQVIDISYQIERLKNENTQLREENAALRAEQAVLVAPERIDRQARQLGLVSPDQQTVRILQASVIELPARDVVAQAVATRNSLHE